MKIFGLTIGQETSNSERRTPHVALLTEEELNAALAGAHEKQPVYRAIMQLIATVERSAHTMAAEELKVPNAVTNTHRIAGYIGGAEHLQTLREEIEERRSVGAAAVRAVKPHAEVGR